MCWLRVGTPRWSAFWPPARAQTGAISCEGDVRPLFCHCFVFVFVFKGGGTLDGLNYTTFGWGYWQTTPVSPAVDKMKWIEPRFVTQVCARWNWDKTDQVQTAYFNGEGFETWQNICETTPRSRSRPETPPAFIHRLAQSARVAAAS